MGQILLIKLQNEHLVHMIRKLDDDDLPSEEEEDRYPFWLKLRVRKRGKKTV